MSASRTTPCAGSMPAAGKAVSRVLRNTLRPVESPQQKALHVEGFSIQVTVLAYLLWPTMYSRAATTSASLREALPPLAGIWLKPCRAWPFKVSRPLAMRGAQAALSPILGAPSTPVPWQAEQVPCQMSLPDLAAAAGAAAGVDVAIWVEASPETCTSPTGARRWSMSCSSTAL